MELFCQRNPPRRLRRRSIFLVFATHHDLQNIIRQRPLQPFRLIPRRTHPDIVFFRRGKDHRHGLGMYGLDNRIWRGREKTIDEMRPWDWLGLSTSIALEHRPDAGEGKQRAIVDR
jgi:hypothetical protein